MCSLEFPDLEAIYQDYKDRGVTVIGVNTGGLTGPESAETVERFVEQTQVTFPIGYDTGDSAAQYRNGDRVSPLPIDVIVDESGVMHYLSYAYNADELRFVLDQLVGPQ